VTPKTAPAPAAAPVMEERGNRKSLEGVVVSDKMDKTRVIKVTRSVLHPFYKKVMTKSKKFHAHDEANEAHEGDLVEIVSTRPLSKLKRWRIVRVVKAARRVTEVK
jgi:small subunit ribosomal protein S17